MLNISFFFFNDTATTEIYTLSLHDALPISRQKALVKSPTRRRLHPESQRCTHRAGDRKSTRLNSSYITISYAVFCLKKKKIKINYILLQKKKKKTKKKKNNNSQK